jgi:hypothetical protein
MQRPASSVPIVTVPDSPQRPASALATSATGSNPVEPTTSAQSATGRPRKLRGDFWKLCTLQVVNGVEKVSCKRCPKQYVYAKSQSNMRGHWSQEHRDDYKVFCPGSDDESVTSTTSTTSMSSIFPNSKTRVPSDRLPFIRDCLVEWLTTSGRPLSIVDDPGLNKLLQVATNDAKFQLVSRQVIKRHLDDVLKEPLRSRLAAVKLAGQFEEEATNAKRPRLV